MADIIVQAKRYNANTQTSDNLIPQKANNSSNANSLIDTTVTPNINVAIDSISTTTFNTPFIETKTLLYKAPTSPSTQGVIATDHLTHTITLTNSDLGVTSLSDLADKQIEIGISWGTSMLSTGIMFKKLRLYATIFSEILTLNYDNGIYDILTINYYFDLGNNQLQFTFKIDNPSASGQYYVDIYKIYLIN